MQTIVNNTKNEIMCCNMIHLHEGECEFVLIGGKLKTILFNDIVDFEDTPSEYLDVIREDIHNPYASVYDLKDHVLSNLSGFDKTVDVSLLTGKVNYTETIGKFDNGSEITRGEFAVLEHIHQDAKDIAELIFRTKSTVENHIAAMKIKSGLTTKELIAFAERKNYLLCFS